MAGDAWGVVVLGLGSEVLTGVFAPDASAAFQATLAAHQRHSTSAEHAERLLAACYAISVADDLGAVRAGTHVFHRDGGSAKRAGWHTAYQGRS